jgi:hypothetical protein
MSRDTAPLWRQSPASVALHHLALDIIGKRPARPGNEAVDLSIRLLLTALKSGVENASQNVGESAQFAMPEIASGDPQLLHCLEPYGPTNSTSGCADPAVKTPGAAITKSTTTMSATAANRVERLEDAGWWNDVAMIAPDNAATRRRIKYLEFLSSL